VEGISRLISVPMLLLLSLAAYGEPAPRNALLQDARRSGEFLVVLGGQSPEVELRMREVAEGLRFRRRGSFKFLEASEATDADLALGGPRDSGFTPNGKPAEEVIRRGYARRVQ